MSLYELAILGSVSEQDQATLSETLTSMLTEFNLTMGKDVVIRNAETFSERNIKAATAVAYFGGSPHVDHDHVEEALKSSLPVIPTIADTQNFETVIPKSLQASNGLCRREDDPQLTELAASMLECAGLLRRQRRVFLSYRRTESRNAAVDLHDLLVARGFEVFLDTHVLRPAEPFQDVLWHRLCDSDVLVMLDTPNYYESKWTREELGLACAKELHVYRVVWPRHKSNNQLDLSETIYLDPNDLTDTGVITPPKASQIVLGIERLRSRSVAAKSMSMIGKFRAEIQLVGGEIEGVGAHRALSVRVKDKAFWAYLATGIPTAETLHDIAKKTEKNSKSEPPTLVYEDMGIRDSWMTHLRWLGENIKPVRSLNLKEAEAMLRKWGLVNA
jgi:hypothetical protein